MTLLNFQASSQSILSRLRNLSLIPSRLGNLSQLEIYSKQTLMYPSRSIRLTWNTTYKANKPVCIFSKFKNRGIQNFWKSKKELQVGEICKIQWRNVKFKHVKRQALLRRGWMIIQMKSYIGFQKHDGQCRDLNHLSYKSIWS